MHILDLCEFFSDRGGGVRSYLVQLARAAKERGHRLTVVAPGASNTVEPFEGGRLIRFAAPPMPYDPTYRAPWRPDRMRRIVRDEKPDVLQVSSPFLPAMVSATLKSVPLRSYVYHSDPIGCYLRPAAQRYFGLERGERALAPAWAYMRSVCRAHDVTVCAGHWLASALSQHGCQKVEAVPFGISHQDFGPDRYDEGLRTRLLGPLSGEEKAKLLLIAGRLAMDKRQALLIEAVIQLTKTRPVALVVLGDGPERERLIEQAKGLPAVTFLRFTKDRAEYASLLASVDALIHASRCETYGFVLAETLASGTPIVVPDDGGAVAMAAPAYAEIYPATSDARGVAKAIDRLLDRPAPLLKAAARKAAAEHPSTQEHFDGLFALYDRMLRARGWQPH